MKAVHALLSGAHAKHHYSIALLPSVTQACHCSVALISLRLLDEPSEFGADLKNNEVDVLFYRLNNEVVCFREQTSSPPPPPPPPPPPLYHKDTIPHSSPSSLMEMIYA
ncbi:unnamed protein product [Pleuronectes platessa]|uniref:Uncharacterized protein n=1 Tax=Pleuronectes platessa TaxID=8262 RepID=A0A9N7VQG9_PLEPL|nr:unnamed protein product [Pleuronectes platessa]